MSDQKLIEKILENIKSNVGSSENTSEKWDLPACKSVVSSLDMILEEKKHNISKLKKHVKTYYTCINSLIEAELALAEALSKYNNTIDEEELRMGLDLFPDIFKNNAKNRQSSLWSFNNLIYYPCRSLLKNDLKSIQDIKKSIDETFKEHKNKVSKMEKEMNKKKSEPYSQTKDLQEIEVVCKEFAFHVCEYFLKYHEAKDKFTHGFLRNSIEYTESINVTSKQNLQNIEGLKSVIDHYSQAENQVYRKNFEEFKNNITAIKSQVKSLIPANTNEAKKVELNQIRLLNDGGAATSKSGYILKKSEGFRKTWKKTYCVVDKGYLNLSSGPNEPFKVSFHLLTAQIKDIAPDKDNKHFCFTLFSCSRQLWFSTESQAETDSWVSIINNSMEFEMKQALTAPSESVNDSSKTPNEETVDIFKEYVRKSPGNNICVDCMSENPEWFSTNMGVSVCIECSGIHREIGVRYSRIRSLTIDNLKVWELLLIASIGNYAVNEILDPNPNEHAGINKNSSMEERRTFIHQKYVSRSFMDPQTSHPEDYTYEKLVDMDIFSIVYLFMYKFDFISLKNAQNRTFLHYLMEHQNQENMCTVEFIIANVQNIIDKQDCDGNTALHLALVQEKVEYVKLLLLASADCNIENNEGQTALTIMTESELKEFKSLRDFVTNKRTQRIELSREVVFSMPEFSGEFITYRIFEKNDRRKSQVLNKDSILIITSEFARKSVSGGKLLEDISVTASTNSICSPSPSSSNFNISDVNGSQASLSVGQTPKEAGNSSSKHKKTKSKDDTKGNTILNITKSSTVKKLSHDDSKSEKFIARIVDDSHSSFSDHFQVGEIVFTKKDYDKYDFYIMFKKDDPNTISSIHEQDIQILEKI